MDTGSQDHAVVDGGKVAMDGQGEVSVQRRLVSKPPTTAGATWAVMIQER